MRTCGCEEPKEPGSKASPSEAVVRRSRHSEGDIGGQAAGWRGTRPFAIKKMYFLSVSVIGHRENPSNLCIAREIPVEADHSRAFSLSVRQRSWAGSWTQTRTLYLHIVRLILSKQSLNLDDDSKCLKWILATAQGCCDRQPLADDALSGHSVPAVGGVLL